MNVASDNMPAESFAGFAKLVSRASLIALTSCLLSVNVAGAADAPALPGAALDIDVPMPVQGESSENERGISFSGPEQGANSAPDGENYVKKLSDPAEKTFRRYPNQITLYIVRTPKDINWSNATSVFRSYFSNSSTDDNSVGHVAFEVSCVSESGKTTVITGQTDGSNSKDYLAMLWHNMGYNVFFGHVPGVLQTRSEVEEEFGGTSQKKGRSAFATFIVSPKSCEEAVRFVETYKSEKVYTRFGLSQRPLHKEGACCANLAAAVLRVAGVADYDKDWSRTFYIPNRLLMTRVLSEPSFLDVLGLYDWTVKPSEPYRVLHFFDPDLMHRWVTAHSSAAKVHGHKAVETYVINTAPGFVLDYSDSGPTSWWLSD